MARASSGDPIAALREEIRRAGRWTGRIRVLLIAVPPAALIVGFWLVYFCICTVLDAEILHPPPHLWWMRLLMTGREAAARGALGLLASLPAGLCAAGLYRLWRRRRVFVALSGLGPEQRGSVLLPLRVSTDGDVRRIAASLLAELGVPTELTPAASPDARGDEASPAEAKP